MRGGGGLDKYGVSSFILFFFKWINCRANFVHRLYTYIDIDRNIFEHRNDYNRIVCGRVEDFGGNFIIIYRFYKNYSKKVFEFG